jgi:hypothetical protein
MQKNPRKLNVFETVRLFFQSLPFRSQFGSIAKGGSVTVHEVPDEKDLDFQPDVDDDHSAFLMQSDVLNLSLTASYSLRARLKQRGVRRDTGPESVAIQAEKARKKETETRHAFQTGYVVFGFAPTLRLMYIP